MIRFDTDRNNSIVQKILTVIFEDLKVDNGTIAKAGNRIKVHYLGKLLNGTTFDACLKKPFPFRLGKGEVILGWDMMNGGKLTLHYTYIIYIYIYIGDDMKSLQ